MGTAMPQMDQLKKNMKAAWMAGDFGQIAKFNETEGTAFVERVHIQRGSDVLDVACGTGNLAIPAARLGANVIGVDIATNLLEQARTRAAKEELKAEFREGDAEALAFPDAQFDAVISMFGAMFAPRPELVVSELTRVCKPNGFIAMANWTPRGFVSRQFKTMAKHVPPPPGLASPLLWGDESELRKRFAHGNATLQAKPIVARMAFPFSVPETVEFYRLYFGPTQRAFAALPEEKQGALRRDLEDLYSRHNKATDGTTDVEAEYLEVVAKRS